MEGKATIQQYKLVNAVLELHKQDKQGKGFTFKDVVRESGINEHTARNIFNSIRSHLKPVDNPSGKRGHPRYTIKALAIASGALSDLRMSILENLSDLDRSQI